MPVKKLKLLTVVLVLMGPELTGCGTVNVQASGGGVEGFASLGAIILGTTALRHIRGSDRDFRHDKQIQLPPDTTPELQEDYGEPDSKGTVENH